METASRSLVVSCADIEADFVKKELADLTHRCELLEQQRRGPSPPTELPPPTEESEVARVNGVSSEAQSERVPSPEPKSPK